MRRTVLAVAVLAPLVVALSSCGGGEDDQREVEGMVSIDAVADPMYRATPQLSGSRMTSVHTVNWSTAAGASGAANLTVQHNCFAIFVVFSECNHGWTASIPLVVGTNVITVIGYGRDGEWGQATMTITRLACPPQFVPEACS